MTGNRTRQAKAARPRSSARPLPARDQPRQAKAGRPQSRASSLPARGQPREPSGFPIVGIGASAGGLDACRKLFDALPAGNDMAFVLVQHLDPTHESMMVDLLAGHTPLTVRQATDGMPIEPEYLYVIPPGTYLSVGNGALHLSQPQARHGARLPFDFLLHSLAEECGTRAICIVLSGTGADGSLGLKAVKEKGGFVIAQDPDEASYDGMPRNAIKTGAVDLVVPVAKIPAALAKYNRRRAVAHDEGSLQLQDTAPDLLSEIISLLRTKTTHDFTLYKRGTVERRIGRRMALSAIETDDMERYLELLRSNPGELELLAKDLLINVTSFFRDPKVFDYLTLKIIPDLVADKTPDQSLRIWIAGCSTGEETYSLAMLFREQIAAAKRDVKLQIFASDVDPDAVARAREGLYSVAIEADVSSDRLARFFSKEDHGYRILPDLRDTVVFTVQDLLADPPFSRLDMVSCRNLLIYLGPEAQAKVISLFHFALREGGILLLGNSETVGNADGRFKVISKSERLYQHVARSRLGEFDFSTNAGSVRVPARPGQNQGPSRQAVLAGLCQRLVLETFAPAAVLINRRHECLYSLGPTDRYLHVVPGHPTHDLLAMAHPYVRARLRSAIQEANVKKTRTVVTGGRMNGSAAAVSFNIDVRPVPGEGEALLLVCFVDVPQHDQKKRRAGEPRDVSRIAELERELEATQMELRGAIRSLEISGEEQKAINEEALSVNEEFQSTNEELLASKEELQSLNEELTALNGQLQETLERQRTTANDLQNVLYSTNVATIFLDPQLNIRMFTPAAKALFNVIPSDVGRPLADLSSLAADGTLLSDARKVLQTHAPREHEIKARTDAWYMRRILPYRTQDNHVEGVVITFVDVSERRHAADALVGAERQARLATVAKSRFLAAASHDLRQPLQTLALLQGLLAKTVEGTKAQKLVGRLDETLGAMSGMLNALLDINQIEAGTISADIVDFPINELLTRLRDEFAYQAQAHGLVLRAVPCRLSVRSDPRLLEQMIRNLLSNALKYTKHGKVLLGCRRHDGILCIEVWDTGVGIPDAELNAIFEEYHQLENAARQRSLGLGLGLSIVHRLGKLLDHRVRVRSQPGKGSVFAIEVNLPPGEAKPQVEARLRDQAESPAIDVGRSGTILIVEDDPEVLDLLELVLKNEGHRVATAAVGTAALELVTRGAVRPDLILTDYNLPDGMNGLQLSVKLREKLHPELPIVILTGDISTGTMRHIALQNCVQLNKPVKLKELRQAIERLLPVLPVKSRSHAPRPAEAASNPEKPIIYVVDDSDHVREGIREVLEDDGRTVEDYASCEAFLDAYRPGHAACLLLDAYLPGMNGLDLLQRLDELGHHLPTVMITGNSDVSMAIQAMKTGALDLIEKPVSRSELLERVERALELSQDATKLSAWRDDAAQRLAGLTPRQRQILELVLAGHPSKNIAADLGISQRTVENHRASIMTKTGAKSLPALARLALAAA